MRRALALTLLLALPALAACGDRPIDRTGTGAALGAAAGAGVGVVLGPVGVVTGALVGAGAGAVTGLVTDRSQINLGRPIYRR